MRSQNLYQSNIKRGKKVNYLQTLAPDGVHTTLLIVKVVVKEVEVEKEVVPALVNNRDKMGKLIGSLEKQLTEKGEEINGYMEKRQIQVKNQEGGKKGPSQDEGAEKSGGVLVSK